MSGILFDPEAIDLAAAVRGGDPIPLPVTEMGVRTINNPSTIDSASLTGHQEINPAPDNTITNRRNVDPVFHQLQSRDSVANLTSRVEVGTMSRKARIRYQSAVARQQFSSNTDQFIWTIGLTP